MDEALTEKRRQLLQALRNAGARDERVLAAIDSTPRELFVEAEQQSLAYDDRALPIRLGQTISQPLMVAVMTEALQLRGDERVLEIGTGSGYQAALLAQLAKWVYTIERHQQLAYLAAERLEQLNLRNVSVYVGDGSLGWPEQAPYDCILVTAAAPEISPVLLSQLRPWGRLVVPVGPQERQQLLVTQLTPQGPRTSSLGGCVFVPLVGAEGWEEPGF